MPNQMQVSVNLKRGTKAEEKKNKQKQETNKQQKHEKEKNKTKARQTPKNKKLQTKATNQTINTAKVGPEHQR